jgi:ADP-ribose pyrophosphatase
MRNEKVVPFKKVASEIGYQGRAFTMRRDRLELPDGRTVVYDIIDHPGAVTIIPLNEQGDVLFIRQYRPATGEVLLELPAGTLEKGEEPLHCAQREIREETGYAATQMTPLGGLWLAPGYSSEYLHYFLAEGLYPSHADGDDDEFISVENIPYEHAIRMALNGEIRDGKSLAGLLLLQGHRQEG